MSTCLHNLSDYDEKTVPNAKGMRFVIVVSEWNKDVTGALLEGAVNTLLKHGTSKDDIKVETVPGSFELVYRAAKHVKLAEKFRTTADAVIVIGCVIRGETPHFDYICQGTTQGIASLNAKGVVPIVYGLLTCETLQQAWDRCGGELGNKGVECAQTAIKMVKLDRPNSDVSDLITVEK